MSLSTLVRVTVGMTAVEYTYGSGSIAHSHGICAPRNKQHYQGDQAVYWIENTEILPELELELVRKLLAQHKRELEEFNEDNPYPHTVDAWVSVTLLD